MFSRLMRFASLTTSYGAGVLFSTVIPAEAGIQDFQFPLGPCFRRGEVWGELKLFSSPGGPDVTRPRREATGGDFHPAM